jgi:RNA polymerase sigma-70 factor (sigma-E family)
VRRTSVMAVSTPEATPRRPESWTADEALERLYAAHHRALVRLAVLLLRDREAAEEVVQDSFVAVHGHWAKLRDPDLGLAYLRRTVVNRSRSALRRRAVEQRHLRSVTTRESVLPGPDEALAVTERRQRVLAALQELPRRQREVLVLRHYADLDEAGVATTLGISRGAVKSHAHRGAARLRQLLEEER